MQINKKQNVNENISHSCKKYIFFSEIFIPEVLIKLKKTEDSNLLLIMQLLWIAFTLCKWRVTSNYDYRLFKIFYQTELGIFLMVDIGINAWSTLFLISKLNNACFPLFMNLQIN